MSIPQVAPYLLTRLVPRASRADRSEMRWRAPKTVVNGYARADT